MGGPTRIDSVQNVITLRSDLHGAWDNYEFGVDPNVSPIRRNLFEGLILNRITTVLLPLPVVIKT